MRFNRRKPFKAWDHRTSMLAHEAKARKRMEQTLNDKINMQTETNDGNGKGQQTLAPAGLLGARPITPEDVIKEADRNYDLGRKHGHDEKADLLDWAETLLCNSLPMSHCTQEEWDRIIKSWRDQKHGASAPNEKS